MITRNIFHDRPMTGWGIICKKQPTVIEVPNETVVSDICVCECNYEEIVYANSDDKNDIRTFISEVPTIDDTLDFFLVKNGVEYALDDNTYGTFYDFGDLSGHPTKKGYYLNWHTVYTALGFGQYTVITRKNYFGQDFESESHIYKLQQFNPETAKKYIFIEVYQNGKIDGVFDYRNLNWYQAFRIKGSVLSPEYELTSDDTTLNETSQRQRLQGVTKLSKGFKLSLSGVPSKVGDFFLENGLLADDLTFTNYDYTAYKLYTSQKIRQSEAPTVKIYPNHRLADIEIKFNDLRESIVKRR